jgi:4-amino-4-deoxy-L-arabinose transferase-like glycosyltransferase
MEKMAHLVSLKTSKVGWIKSSVIKNWPIIAIVLLASFLRLYRISDYMTFLGDEGRDVLVVKHILEGDLTLLGPRASAGDFFTGPIYYYLIAPFLWLFKLDPVGPAIFIALVGIATVYLIFRVSKEFFGLKTAIFASSLYAVSPLVLFHSRSSWNPNPMPLVSLLTLYVTHRAIIKPTFKKFLFIGFLLGIAMQLHYISVFLGIIVFVYVLIGNIYSRVSLKSLLIYYGEILAGFIVGLSPFLAFELKHGLPNIRTIFNFIFSTTQQTYIAYGSFADVIKDVFFRLFARLVTRFPPPEQIGTLFDKQTVALWQAATLALAILSVIFLFRMKNTLVKMLFLAWFILGIVLFGFYKKPIHDHYFGFMFPLPFILIGNLLSKLNDSGIQVLKPISIAIFVGLFLFNLSGAPFRYEPNRQKEQVKKISEFVISKAENKPFNFALITPGNSDHAYRYYFEVLGHPDVRMENPTFDPQRKTVTDQLLIVCENVECKPLGHPLFEISNFGRAEIVGEWQVSVVKVFKLIHYRE